MPKKTIFFDSYCGYEFSTIVESGKITDFAFEKKGSTSIIGNIYKGRIETILPGMNAAFINCGLERNCYLSADDAYPDTGKYDGTGEAPSFPELKEGDEIAVQVVKAPVGNKGAKVTPCFSFVGKNLIYMPQTSFIGVSRKITDEELRKNLIYSATKLKSLNEGIVMRTSAPYAKRANLESELKFLRNTYAEMTSRLEMSAVGDLLYSEFALSARVMRDTLSYEIERIIVGNEQLESTIRSLVNLFPPALRPPVLRHNSGRDMLDEYGLSEQIFEISSPKVKLENGAYLVIEKTEALTVIDVNTGKYTGSDQLEQTVYYTNILAAREIARQVKLRNIGGIVVVDFIDMHNPAHGKSVVEELERALRYDTAKCSVAPMSKFGLVEFTRKRVGSSQLSQMTQPCKHCRDGRVKTSRYTLIGMRAKILNLYTDGHRVIRLDMNTALLEVFKQWQELLDDLKEHCPQAEIYGVPHGSYSEEHVIYAVDGHSPLPAHSVKII